MIDEADALLAGRTGAGSATDRYGNADVDVLLHLLERHDGLVILTTNLADTLDPALQRRCRFVVGFRRPRRAERLRLWQRLIPAACPVDPGIDYGILAEHELTGAQIRAAAWAAARPPSEQRVVVIKRC